MPSKRGAKRKTMLEHEPLSDDGSQSSLFVRDEAREDAKRRRSRGKSLSRLEEYYEDEGRDGSREFQQWAKWLDRISKDEAKDSKTHLIAFQKKTDKLDQQIRSFIENREEDLKQRNQQFVTDFKKVYAASIKKPSLLHSSEKQQRGAVKEGSSLFEEAQSIVTSSHSLLKCYRDADESLKSHQLELPEATWKKDKEDIKQLLDDGREHGQKIVEKNLVPHTSTPPDDKNKNHLLGEMVTDMFNESRKTLEGECWGSMAAEQFKRFRNLATMASVKHLR